MLLGCILYMWPSLAGLCFESVAMLQSQVVFFVFVCLKGDIKFMTQSLNLTRHPGCEDVSLLAWVAVLYMFSLKLYVSLKLKTEQFCLIV